MNRHDMLRYRAILEAKQKELMNAPRNREEIVVQRTPEATDEVQLAEGRDFAIRILDGESRRLKEVQEALERVQNGTFGLCSECGEPISAKRLAAVPWASCCIRCQELQDELQHQDAFAQPQSAA